MPRGSPTTTLLVGGTAMAAIETITALPPLPPRPRDSHKGTYGRVLIVAGAPGMSGAGVLAGLGALRGGAGLVQVATPASIQSIVAAGNPCYLTAGLPSGADGTLSTDALPQLFDLVNKADVLALGPGLGQSEDVTQLVAALLRAVQKPIVLDADGLNALAHILKTEPWQPRAAPLLCTPHPGEFSRLIAGEMTDREAQAVAFAQARQVLLVLKGHRTLVTDGQRMYRNTTGNPGMATGGTGDVLTGLIAALLGQQMPPFAAAQLGVYLHGLAGDMAAAELGEMSLTALEVAHGLPQAIRQQWQK
jgi:ADP-dependent NAD(P)H-hydrate dehydratase